MIMDEEIEALAKKRLGEVYVKSKLMADLELAAGIAKEHAAKEIEELERGIMKTRPNFCSWNVRIAMEWQGADFEGFEMVFGSLGFPTGISNDVFFEYGDSEYATMADFGLLEGGFQRNGFKGHCWMANAATGEIADISFPNYREISEMRRMIAKGPKMTYNMNKKFDGLWVKASAADWRKFGLVHLPAPEIIQCAIKEDFATLLDVFNIEGVAVKVAFYKTKVMRVPKKRAEAKTSSGL